MVALLAIALACQPPIIAIAQQPAPGDDRTITPRDTSHQKRHQTLFTYRDAALAAGFVGLTVAMFPVDKHIAGQLQNENLTTNRFLQHSATGFESIAAPGAYVIGGGLYLAGRLLRKPDLADLGWHGTEAVLLAYGVTGFLKGTLGRSRPFVSADTNPHDFRFGAGFSTSERQSFP